MAGITPQSFMTETALTLRTCSLSEGKVTRSGSSIPMMKSSTQKMKISSMSRFKFTVLNHMKENLTMPTLTHFLRHTFLLTHGSTIMTQMELSVTYKLTLLMMAQLLDSTSLTHGALAHTLQQTVGHILL